MNYSIRKCPQKNYRKKIACVRRLSLDFENNKVTSDRASRSSKRKASTVSERLLEFPLTASRQENKERKPLKEVLENGNCALQEKIMEVERLREEVNLLHEKLKSERTSFLQKIAAMQYELDKRKFSYDCFIKHEKGVLFHVWIDS